MAEKENNQFALIALVGIVAVVGIVGLVFSMSATPNAQYVPVEQSYGVAADAMDNGNVVGDAIQRQSLETSLCMIADCSRFNDEPTNCKSLWYCSYQGGMCGNKYAEGTLYRC